MKGKFLIVISILMTLWSCSEQDAALDYSPVNNDVNEFVWGALNSWYYWHDEVTDLRDNRFSNLAERNQFINQFSTPESLFEYLRHPDDEFSWMVDNYITLQNSFAGVSLSFGFEFGLLYVNSTDIIGYVTYVLPDTEAENKGIMRGDIFYGIDGNQLSTNNYIDLLTQSTITINFAEVVNDSILTTDQTTTITAQEISENPVYMAKTFDVNGTKVGYLMYNQFIHTRHSELNEAFGQLRSENATELILDLRYNPGGSVLTSLILAGMIYKQGTEGNTFSKLVYNDKKTAQNFDFPFLTEVPILDSDFDILSTEQMNRLNLDRVFILTTRGTASASEIIINGLTPYMEVIHIGDTTRGKNEGSVTLYDSPVSDYRNVESANPRHLYALQPIVSKIANAVGYGDYGNGLLPDYPIRESHYFDQLVPIGDVNDPLIDLALSIITGDSGPGRMQIENGRNIRPVERPNLDNSFPANPILNGLDFPMQ
jgi:carboxyl-terminal processing protease